MALNIYENADPDTGFSDDTSFDNPLRLTMDGSTGGSLERILYVRNDNVSRSYTNIEVTPIDGGDGVVDGSNGYSWKLYAGYERPLAEQWAQVSPGNTIDIPDISDTNTYSPFWVRIDVPRGAPVESFQGVQLEIVADES